MAETNNDAIYSQDNYKYGFKDKDVSILDTGKGLTEEIVRKISAYKNEPQWMTDFRVKAFHEFEKMPMQEWGPDLSDIDFQDFTYYKKVTREAEKDWEDVKQLDLDEEAANRFLLKFHRILKNIEIENSAKTKTVNYKKRHK